MELLTSLGVNSSLFAQIGIFLVTYIFLKYLLFKPYFAAYNERAERTVGKAELAERFVAETHELEERFAQKAQEINERYKAIYDKTRAEALKEYDRLVTDARARTKVLADETRKKIHAEMVKAKTELSHEVSSVSQLINQKLLGKDLTA